MVTKWDDDVLDKLEEWGLVWCFDCSCIPLKSRNRWTYTQLMIDDDNNLLAVSNQADQLTAEEFLKQAAKQLGKEYPMKQKLKFGDIVDVWDDTSDTTDTQMFICYTPNGVMVADCCDREQFIEDERMYGGSNIWTAFYQHIKPTNTVKEMTIAEIEEELGYSIKIKE